MPLIQSFPPVDGQTVQAEVLPTAGAAQLNKIYQYVGTTTPQYVNGYFYKCIYNNPNYEWVNVLVQPEADPDPSIILTGTILANGWNNNAQTVTVNDFDSSIPGTIGLLNTVTGEQYAAAANAGLRVTAIANNSVTFSCEETPEIDIPFGILIPGTTIGGGGGGTTVIANPSGEATDDLEKLQVGQTIYDIPTGGGGSSSLAGLDDVNLSSPTDGQVLKYDATNDEWVNGEGGGSGDGDMKKSVYDSDLDVAGAGGIKAFVSDAVSGKVDKVEGKGLSTNDYDDTEKGKVADATGAIEAMVNVIFTPGRDLTVVFADEIANYSDEWAWIQARLNSHNVSGLRVGDYIPIKVGAENHLAEIAGINTYRRTGDTGHEVGYHIDWITRDCYSQTVQFNTTNNNNGNANSPSPFLASNLKSWLDGTLYGLLDAKLKAVIKAKRILAPYRYQSGATLTDDNSWGWQDFDKLWVPLEGEIFDSLVWSTKGYGNGQAVQYPIFANSYEHRMKGAGPGGARAHWWTASASSGYSGTVVHVTGNGNSSNGNASTALCVPVCFRTMEA